MMIEIMYMLLVMIVMDLLMLQLIDDKLWWSLCIYHSDVYNNDHKSDADDGHWNDIGRDCDDDYNIYDSQ